MISSDIMTLYSGGQSLLGKRVSSLVGNDIKVLADGSVTGTLKQVNDYTQFSSVKEEQSGRYFPFKLTQTGTTMTIKKNGVAADGKEDMVFDPSIVVRVENKTDTFAIEVDDVPVVTLNFKNSIFA